MLEQKEMLFNRFKFMANYVNVLEVNEGPYSGAHPWGFNFGARAYW